ncbi:MAG: 2-succinyl-5-enolpyruvyl-6-hydroxy-3-cyclohexene-1-carboxylic-acid synthase [Flavobacteriales bacterium]
MISDKRTVQDFFSLLEAKGVHHVVICPGSRNAPFSISLYRHPIVQSYNIPDERSAAFFAMGMAQQFQKPVAIICTSGTAALNFAPAIAEAFYQRVPLLIVTADRPVEWIDQGEGQSIRQRDVYSNYIKSSLEVMEESANTDSAWYNVRIMDEAIGLCTSGVAGPVHINFPLREPLYGRAAHINEVKVVERLSTPSALKPEMVVELKNKLSAANRILILAGQSMPDDKLHAALLQWAHLPQVAVMTEAHSNLADEQFITTIDRLILRMNEDEIAGVLPEILITYGHNIISRKIKEYLRKSQCEHWHVDISGEGLDTLKHLNKIIAIEPQEFFERALPSSNSESSYGVDLLNRNTLRREKAVNFMQRAQWSDLKAFDVIYRNLPMGQDLQMGNSSVVRYILLFDARRDVRHFGNRGVAGIDGCTSTAVGAAWSTQRPTTLISGDIGFFYDSNAFWHNYVSKKLKIIVINNAGGGIFRIIEGPKSTPSIDAFFETTHDRKADKLAAMYGLSYKITANEEELKAGLVWLYAQDACSVLEVTTPRLENDVVLKQYFDSLV